MVGKVFSSFIHIFFHNLSICDGLAMVLMQTRVPLKTTQLWALDLPIQKLFFFTFFGLNR